MPRLAPAGRNDTGSGSSWRGRRVAFTLQLLGVMLVVCSVIVGVFASHAGAAGLSNGPVIIKIASTGSVATTPLADGQVVDVVVAPNSTLSRSSLEAAGFPSGAVAIKIVECADSDGTAASLPKSPNDCAGTTIRAVEEADVDEDGGLLREDYTVYALPDQADLGASNGTVCDNTHQCVLGIFSDQLDFSKPHLFSAPFQVTPSGLPNGAIPTSASGSSSSSSASSSGSSSASSGASPGVSVSPATLADTGGPALWPWLLGAGCVLLIAGSALRYLRRPAHAGRR